jgi:Ca-activated chloride channel homolog
LKPNLRTLLLFTLIFVLVSLAIGQSDKPISPRVPRPGNDPQAAQQQNQTSAQQDQTATFRTEVKLVNVYATVLDQQGGPVGGLTKDNFKITEDGVPQTIALFGRESEMPLSIVMAIDVSLSAKKELKLEVESARRFVHALVRPQDSLSLYQFSERVDELTKFTSNMATIDGALDRIHNGSATALYDAIYLGSRALTNRQGRKVLIVITDGGDTMSSVDYHEALRGAQESEAVVYSLIVQPVMADAGRDLGGEHALIQMSHDTGGKHFYASAAELDKTFKEVSDELRTQYMLAYYPVKRLASSQFRKIKVDVNADVPNGPVLARHRTGYYVSSGSF